MPVVASRRTKSNRRRVPDDAPPPFAVRRFSVEEYHRLMEIGILRSGDPYELLDGWITRKMTHNPAHDVCVDLLDEFFNRNLPKGWRPRIQSSISLSASEPEPDVAIVRGLARDYSDRHPTPESIALVIEVADSSVDRDRIKAQLYADGRIPRYWLVNLPERVIEDYSQPVGRGPAARYKHVQIVSGDDVASLVLGKKALPVRVEEILP